MFHVKHPLGWKGRGGVASRLEQGSKGPREDRGSVSRETLRGGLVWRTQLFHVKHPLGWKGRAGVASRLEQGSKGPREDRGSVSRETLAVGAWCGEPNCFT